MASCRACGAALGRQFRFCSQCGTAAGVEIDLLDLAPPAHDETTVQFGRPGRFWAAVAGGVVVVAIGLRLLAGLGDGGRADDAADRERPTTTVRSASTTTAAEPTAPSAAEAGRSTTTGSGPSTSVVAGGGSMVGQPVGLSLLIGSDLGLRRIDVDTGVVTTYRLVGWPMLASGGHVLVQKQSGALRSVPVNGIDDAAADVAWSNTMPGTAVAGPEPGQVWLSDEQGDGLLGWSLVQLDSGEVLSRVEVGPVVWWASSTSSRLDPMVLGSSAGGVFERHDDGFRRVADGELLAVSRTVAVTRTCSDPDTCQLHWLDRATWSELNRAVPDVDPRALMTVSVSDDGRVLLYGTVTGSSQLFDVDRGQDVVAVVDPGNLAVSSDGRWVAVVNQSGRLGLYDIDQGELTDLPLSTSNVGRVIVLPPGT